MKTYLKSILLLALPAISIGCSRRDQNARTVEAWVGAEYRILDLAYHAQNTDDAIRTLKFLVRDLEIKAKENPKDQVLYEAIWINKMRLAGVFYVSGDAANADGLIEEILKAQNNRGLSREKIRAWLLGEYRVRNPAWGRNAEQLFRGSSDAINK